MAPPRGQFGNRLDTAAGRAKEAQMQAAAAAAASGNPNAAAMAAAIPNAPAAFTQAVAQSAPAMTSRPVQVEMAQSTPGPTIQRVTEYGQAPSISIPAGGGQATYTPGDYDPNEEFAQWARDIGATGAPGARGAAAPTGPTPEERAAASAFLANILRQYGMQGMMGQIDSLISQWGINSAVIIEKLRDTGEYKQRFKGLVNLRERGITDIANEGQYIQFESSYRRVFRDNDLQSYLGTPGSQQEIDRIAQLVGDFSLSVDEVEERVIDARRAVADTAPEVRDSLQRFYNITPDLMVEFVLDPENTSEVVQRRANAAVVGGYAQRAGLEFGAGVSERIGAFLGGERDIQGTQIEPQLTEIADIQRSTQRLAEIEQGELSAETSALSALNLDQEARERVRTLQSRERARFGGRSGITTGSLAAGPGI